MTENIESTEGTQPNKPVTKSRRGRTILFGVLVLIAILVIAILAGYSSGIGVRQKNQSTVIMQQLGEQYQNTLIDIQFGRYEIAKQRLEWIIANDPTFPGAQQKLTEVLVLSNQPTPSLTPSLTPTPDFTGAQDAFARAQQLVTAQDWPGAIGALDQMRKYDPNYNTSLVDGMYYFALRNYGYDLIVKQGNLEGGIYQLTLAERFGPLDRDSNGLREGARYYLIGASFWELNWKEAVNYFDQVYRGWGGLWDGTMTSSERFWVASMRYGDELFTQNQYCDALAQYENAKAIAELDQASARNYDDAVSGCYPPTATLEPILSVTPGTPAVTVEVTTEVAPPPATTEPAPTEPPATEPPTAETPAAP
jgi:tetratricopeptide (TPR) repeat protein